MTSKAARRRERQKRAVERFHALAATSAPKEAEGAPTGEILRPTAERQAKGMWAELKPRAPAIDLACDYIGKLYAMKLIEYHHHEAARLFQSIVAAFQADLPIGGYRSCLAEGVGGYDAGDGNPEAMREYERMKRKLGAVRFIYLRNETAKPADARVRDVDVLKRALDAVLQ
jgi:hypothetical protein